MNGKEIRKLASIIRRGGIGVVATDTMYGLVGSALSKKAVARIYRVRKRNKKKPLIVLIKTMGELSRFGVRLDTTTTQALRGLWPSRVSVIFPLVGERWRYLHRGTKTLAFRIPKKKAIAALLRATGPLVAPSANIEGEKPAASIKEACAFFKNRVDFYIESGRQSTSFSTVVRPMRDQGAIVRRGVDFKKAQAFAKSLSGD